MKKCTFLVVLLMVTVFLIFAEGSRESISDGGDVYPSRPVKLIIPFNAGGGSDTTFRILAPKLAEIIGQPVTIVNIGGAGGALGTKEVLNAPADGYTMGMEFVNLWTRLALKTVEFGPDDFELVAQVGTYFNVLTASKYAPFDDLQGLIDAARKAPNSINDATNIGAIIHFNSLSLMDEADIEFNHVQTGGGANRLAALLGGHADIAIMTSHEVVPYSESDEVKLLAALSPNRIEKLPNVPTAKEQGYDTVSRIDYWMIMPKGTDPERVKFMADAWEQVMSDPEIIKKMEGISVIPNFLTGDALQSHVYEEGEKIMAIAERYNLGN